MKLWELYNANGNWDGDTEFEFQIHRYNKETETIEFVEVKKAKYNELDEDTKFYIVSFFVGNRIYLFEE